MLIRFFETDGRTDGFVFLVGKLGGTPIAILEGICKGSHVTEIELCIKGSALSPPVLDPVDDEDKAAARARRAVVYIVRTSCTRACGSSMAASTPPSRDRSRSPPRSPSIVPLEAVTQNLCCDLCWVTYPEGEGRRHRATERHKDNKARWEHGLRPLRVLAEIIPPFSATRAETVDRICARYPLLLRPIDV